MDSERRDVFTAIFRERRWGGQSVSGPGSSIAVTARIRAWLPDVFNRYSIRSLVDAPCGDGIWIRDLHPLLQEYVGIDIVPDLVAAAAKDNRLSHVRYATGDLVKDVLPKADAILCRDCLVHLSFSEGLSALRNMRASNATYLIATTFPTRENVENRTPGGWRPLNLEKDPYPLGRPLEILYERMPNRADQNNDKALGIWALKDML